jgi:hypothetical protein
LDTSIRAGVDGGIMGGMALLGETDGKIDEDQKKLMD